VLGVLQHRLIRSQQVFDHAFEQWSENLYEDGVP
jgi:hypothetical protein